MKAQVLVPGSAHGPLLVLERPLSFWGGVDPDTGRVIVPGHPQEGCHVGGQVIALERSIGSSSGSSILLELLWNGRGPRAIILAEPDAILTLGALVAREMGFAEIPVLQLSAARFSALPRLLSVNRAGVISVRDAPA